jgi:hypothetical protein
VIHRPQSLRRAGAHEIGAECHIDEVALPEFMSVREWQKENVTCGDRAALARRDLDRAAAGGDQMKDADMA